nr:immunoglobulin-like domain-containing protein [Photobacterium leiognathi]
MKASINGWRISIGCKKMVILTANITVSGTVNTAVAGQYELVYSITDSAKPNSNSEAYCGG